MKSLQAPFFILLLLFAKNSIAQKLDIAAITNRYWGLYLENGKLSLTETFDVAHPYNFVLCKEKTDMFKGKCNGGVMFYSDGRFRQFNKIKCGFDSPGRDGKWVVEDNLIVVHYDYGDIMYFQPKVIFNGKTVFKAW